MNEEKLTDRMRACACASVCVCAVLLLCLRLMLENAFDLNELCGALYAANTSILNWFVFSSLVATLALA